MHGCLMLPASFAFQNEQTTATAIASTANGMGTTIGFLNHLWLAKSSDQIPNIFYFSLGIASLTVAMALFYFPNGPPSPPSAAQVAELDRSNNPETEKQKTDTWCGSLAAASTSRSFLVLTLSVGILSGVASGWQGVFVSILSKCAIQFFLFRMLS